MIFQEFQIFLTALIFFTRLPCSRWVQNPQAYLKETSRYFPLIGWVVGGVAALIVWGTKFLWPTPVAVVLSCGATAMLTGALHEDGFIDVCDGFGGGWTSERILTIMKDSRIGAFGVLGIGLLLALKVLTLTAIPVTLLPAVLWAGHSLSRFASISLLFSYDYARHDEPGRPDQTSKARPVVRRMALKELLFAAIWGILPVAVLLFWPSALITSKRVAIVLVCLASAGLLRWSLGRYFFRTIGGYTGDCLGAVQQVTEVSVYLVCAAFFH